MFNSYSAGNKIYESGRYFPTMGMVNKLGYRDRDMRNKARQQAILKRMQAQQKGRFMSSDYLGAS